MCYPSHLRRFLTCVLMMFAAVFSQAVVSAQVRVVTQHNDNARTGANLSETALNTSNVNVSQFGKLFSRTVTGFIYAQPLYLPGVGINGVTHNVVYVATMNNDVYAFDADDPAQTAPLWHLNFGPARTTNLSTNDFPGQQSGVLSTPVIDPGTNTLYVVSNTSAGGSMFQLHALDAATGQEKFGGPSTIAPTYPGNGASSVNGIVSLYAPTHIQRPGLLLNGGLVYIAFSSTQDMNPYHGWIVAYSAADLTQPALVYNDTPNGDMGGIWQGANGLTADLAGNIYAIAGNGSFDTGTGPNHGNSMIKLDSTLHVLDWFTPHDSAAMNASDLDLGSSGLMGIPGTNYFVGGGKTSVLYMVNADNMGHYNAAFDGVIEKVPLNAFHLHGGPIYWNSPAHGATIYTWAEQDYLKAFSFTNGLIVPTPVGQSSFKAPVNPGDVYGAMPGGILSLSANGSHAGTGIVWACIPSTLGRGTLPGVLRAFDADNLTHELWDSNQNATRDSYGFFGKFTPPTVAGGKVYVATSSGRLVVYGLLPPPRAGGTLTGAVAIPSAAVSLTTEGSSDWTHWGLNGANSYDHKATGGGQISDKIMVGGGGPSGYADNPSSYSWSDGSPTGTAVSTRTGIYVGGVGNGFQFTAPADTTVRTLRVYVGGFQSQGQLTAALSDGSAAVFSDSSLNLPGGSASGDRVYMLSYSAASAGQLLTVTWSLAGDNGGGNVTLQAATLVSGAGTAPVLPPSAPAGLTAAAGNGAASLTWSAVTGAASYSLYRGTGSGLETLLKAGLTSASYADTGLVNGTTYFYQVSAVGPGGESARSAEASVKPVAPVVPPPSAPAGLTAAAGNGSASLTWGAVTSATSYSLYRSTGSGLETLLKAGLTSASYADTGLVNGTTYFYQVSAVGPGGESARSAEASVKPVAPIVPPGTGTLTGAVAIPSAAVSLTTEGSSDWTHWGLHGANSYDHKATGGGQISDKTMIGGSGPNIYADNPSSYSWSDGSPTGTAVSTRTGIYVGGVGNGFQFTAPADTTVRTLRVYVGGWQSQGQLTATLSDGSAAVFSDSSLNLPGGSSGADRVYTLSYSAASAGQHLTVRWTLLANGGGNVTLQAATLVSGAGTAPVLPPSAPAGLTAAAGNGAASLTWSAVTGAASYSLYRGTGSGLETLLKAGLTSASYADTGLVNGTTYFYQVSAVGPGGESARSAEASVKPVAPIVPPGTGTLTGAVAIPSAAVSLTTEGSSDWTHWGLHGANSYDHKATGGGQISDKTMIGGSGPNIYADNPSSYSWSDGSPTGTAVSTRTGIYVGGVGNGFQFTAPADTTVRTLRVYVGGWQSQGQLTATLSDGSAAVFSDSSLNLPGGSSGADRVYTLSYSAASAGQHLTVRWTLLANGGGNVTLQAATLTGSP